MFDEKELLEMHLFGCQSCNADSLLILVIDLRYVYD